MYIHSEEIVISLIITILGYCIVPVILRLTKGKFEYEKGHKIVLINCSVVWLIFTVIRIENGFDAKSGAAVVLYYFINRVILLKSKKIDEGTNEIRDNYDLYLKNEKEQKDRNLIYGDDIKLQKVDNEEKLNNSIEKVSKAEDLIEQQESVREKEIVSNETKRGYIIIGVIIISLIGLCIYDFNIKSKYKGEIKELKAEITKQEEQIESQNIKISVLKYEVESLEKYAEENENVKDKIEFFDDNVVFVIDGYGKYYYTYDQMEKVTQGLEEFSYWAYNKEQAQSLGYKKWK